MDMQDMYTLLDNFSAIRGISPHTILLLLICFIVGLAVFLVATAIITKFINNEADRFLAWLWVMRNPVLKKGKWLSFGTAVGAEPGQCVSRGYLAVRFRIYDVEKQRFYKTKRITCIAMRNRSETDYLDLKPIDENIPLEAVIFT